MRKLTTMSGMDPMRSTSSAVKRNLPKHPGANDTICLCLFAFGGGALPRRKQHHFASFSYCFFFPLKTNTRNAKYYSSKRGRPFLFFVVVTSRCWSFAKTKRNTKKKSAQNEMRNSKAIVHSADRGPDTKKNAKHESFSLSDSAEFNCI